MSDSAKKTVVLWPIVLSHLKAYKEAKGSISLLASASGLSRDILYKILRMDRGISPSHDTVMRLAQCLFLCDEIVYRESMKYPGRVEGVLQVEEECPHVLDLLIELVKTKGGSSKEVKKVLSEIEFLLKQ